MSGSRNQNTASVSVIIPTYNRAAKCLRAVNSALEQEHDNIELIVIDDGSTDNTPDLIDIGDNRIKYIRQKNSGVAAARNRGLREASGSYIAFLDSDDYWLPGKLRAQLAVFDACEDVGMVWTDMAADDQHGATVYSRYLRVMYATYGMIDFSSIWRQKKTLAGIWENCPSNWKDADLYIGNIYSYMFLGNLVHTSTVLATRRRIEAVGQFDEDLRTTGEDYDFHLRTCAEGSVALLDVPTVHYEIGGPDQLTASRYQEMMAFNNIVTLKKAWSKNHKNIDLSRNQIRRRWSHAYWWLASTQIYDNPRECRRNVAISLKWDPLQFRPIFFGLLTFLPSALVNFLRTIKRTLFTGKSSQDDRADGNY